METRGLERQLAAAMAAAAHAEEEAAICTEVCAICSRDLGLRDPIVLSQPAYL